MINFKKGLAALAVGLAMSALASPSMRKAAAYARWHRQAMHRAAAKSAASARRPFTRAACWRPDIRSTSGVTWRFISIAPA